MGGVSKTFGGSSCDAIFTMYMDVSGQVRVSKALF